MEHNQNIKKTARLAGLLYLIMVPFAIFGILYVPSVIMVPGDSMATIQNIMQSASLIRLSIVSSLIVQLDMIFLVVVLYQLLKTVNINIAKIMVIFVVVSVPIAMLNELNHFAVILLTSGSNGLKVLESIQLQDQVMFFLDLHLYGVFIAQIFWGLWLLPLGYLVFKSGYLPKFLGVLLMIGCFGYLVDVGIFMLLPHVELEVSEFTAIGEILFPLWLLIKGVNVENWKKSVA